MPVEANFELKLTGDSAEFQEFQGYDGYMALAGFAWTLALVANYAETGIIRMRGDFPGRDAVRATVPERGSIVAGFAVHLANDPALALGLGVAGGASFYYALVKRIIDRNLGNDAGSNNASLNRLLVRRGGDVEALVARTEPAIRQTHSVIGNGASHIRIVGGHNVLSNFDRDTKDYVRLNVEDPGVQTRSFSVAAFNVNSGYGAVYDSELGRTVPISMSREVLRRVSHIFTWGLDQYAQRANGLIEMTFTRLLAMDETPKRYVVLGARRSPA